MKIGDLVKRKDIPNVTAAKGLKAHKLSYGIIINIKEINQPERFVNSARLITVTFPKNMATHCFPEHYLELINEVKNG